MLALGSQSQVLADLLITRGILNSSLVHPREVFRAAIAEAAAGIIVVHNHPSGDPTPSADDRAVTRQLVDAGRLLTCPVYDHVIVGGERYVSFAEAGLLVTGHTVPTSLGPRAGQGRGAPLRERLDLDLLTPRLRRQRPGALAGRSGSPGDDFLSHSVAVATHSRRAADGLDHHRGRAAARRGRGLRRLPRPDPAGLRHRSRGPRRRSHQALVADLPLDRRGAGGELPQAAPLDREGRPGHHHQARRPAAQHADPRAPRSETSSGASRWRPGRSTRRSRTASGWRA